MLIIGIDPGPEVSGFAVWDPDRGTVEGAVVGNEELRDRLLIGRRCRVVLELLQCYGMPAGKSVLETAEWCGRIVQLCDAYHLPVSRIARPTIKAELCGTAKAKDANVRQALIDRFPGSGGGKVPQIGTKKQPGPLYSVKSHAWAALACAVAWQGIQARTQQGAA